MHQQKITFCRQNTELLNVKARGTCVQLPDVISYNFEPCVWNRRKVLRHKIKTDKDKPETFGAAYGGDTRYFIALCRLHYRTGQAYNSSSLYLFIFCKTIGPGPRQQNAPITSADPSSSISLPWQS